MSDWRDDILEEAAKDQEEPREESKGPKAVRPKHWRRKRKKRRKMTRVSRRIKR